MDKRATGMLLAVAGGLLFVIAFLGVPSWFNNNPGAAHYAGLTVVFWVGRCLGGPILAIWGLGIFMSGSGSSVQHQHRLLLRNQRYRRWYPSWMMNYTE